MTEIHIAATLSAKVVVKLNYDHSLTAKCKYFYLLC